MKTSRNKQRNRVRTGQYSSAWRRLGPVCELVPHDPTTRSGLEQTHASTAAKLLEYSEERTRPSGWNDQKTEAAGGKRGDSERRGENERASRRDTGEDPRVTRG